MERQSTQAIVWMNLEHIILSEIKPVTTVQILYDSIYLRYLEQSNSQRQKAKWWLPGAEGKMGWGGGCLMGIISILQNRKELWRWMVVMVGQQYKCA